MKFTKTMKRAMRHANKLGAGAAKRRKSHLTPKKKRAVVMAEFRRGTLHSGSGRIVTNPKQAVAIAYSESRKLRKKRKK